MREREGLTRNFHSHGCQVGLARVPPDLHQRGVFLLQPLSRRAASQSNRFVAKAIAWHDGTHRVATPPVVPLGRVVSSRCRVSLAVDRTRGQATVLGLGMSRLASQDDVGPKKGGRQGKREREREGEQGQGEG